MEQVDVVLAIFAHFHDRLGLTLPFSMLPSGEQIEITSQIASAYELRRLYPALIELAHGQRAEKKTNSAKASVRLRRSSLGERPRRPR